MSTVEISKALEVAVNSITPALATAWENIDFQPPQPSIPYQAVYVLFAPPENIEFGRGHREIGFMQINLFYPMLGGYLASRTMAELIRNKFYRGASFTSGGVVVQISNTPEVGAGSNENGMYKTIIKIPFFANI